MEDRAVGSTRAWLQDPRETETGVVHMVCVRPEHRGRHLSSVLCLAVLHRFHQREYRRVLLNTHDWRLGAIKVYLRLGFQPVYRDPLHRLQWRKVIQALPWTGPLEPIVEKQTSS